MTSNLSPWRFGGFGSIFEEMDREFAKAEETMNRMFSGMLENVSNKGSPSSYYYGYQITVGPDGKPHVKEFGNVRPSIKGLPKHKENREALVDYSLDKKNSQIIVTAEMPGVSKEGIKINITPNNVSIHAERGEKRYHNEIPVDVELDETSAKASYTNGILELKVKTKQPTTTAASKQNGTEVKVD
jgi:HSP20 family protein